jgi:hypothetical protein
VYVGQQEQEKRGREREERRGRWVPAALKIPQRRAPPKQKAICHLLLRKLILALRLFSLIRRRLLLCATTAF